MKRKAEHNDLNHEAFYEISTKVPVQEIHLDEKQIAIDNAKKHEVVEKQNNKRKKNKNKKRKNKGLAAFMENDSEAKEFEADEQKNAPIVSNVKTPKVKETAPKAADIEV
jgi:hypothetical protein